MELCEHYGLKVQEDNIFGGDKGTSKESNLGLICKKFSPSQINYVDDAIGNLQDILGKAALPEGTSINAYLANWGYVSDGDRQIAKQLGLGCIEQEGLISMLNI